jgi:hypothetical protein
LRSDANPGRSTQEEKVDQLNEQQISVATSWLESHHFKCTLCGGTDVELGPLLRGQPVWQIGKLHYLMLLPVTCKGCRLCHLFEARSLGL